MMREERIDSFTAETYVDQLMWQMIVANPRNTNMALANVAISLPHLAGRKNGHLYRAAYYPVRWIDDYLDCNPRSESHKKTVLDMRAAVESGQVHNSPPGRLLAYAISRLESRATSGDNPTNDFIRVIDQVIYDANRAKVRTILEEKDLEKYFQETFGSVLNIFSMCIGSLLRESNLQVFIYGQGWVYSWRDLDEDLPAGIINIPSEVLTKAGISSNASLNSSQLKSNQHVQDFFESKFAQIRDMASEFREETLPSQTTNNRRIFGTLLASIEKRLSTHLD